MDVHTFKIYGRLNLNIDKYGLFCAIYHLKTMGLNGLAGNFFWGRTLKDKKNVERRDTTITLSKVVRNKLRRIKGRGLSWDRWFNEQFPQETDENEETKETSRSQDTR